MGLISRVSSRTYREKSTKSLLKMFSRLLNIAGRRTLKTTMARKGETPYSLAYRIAPADHPDHQRFYNIIMTYTFAVLWYRLYHHFFFVANEGRGYISAATLTNEQLGLPPQHEMIRLADAIRNGVAQPATAGDDDEEEDDEE